MAKQQKVKLIESNEQEITLEARKMLEKLSVEIVSLPPDPIFEERFDLPILETEEGHRYFGIEGITQFAQRYFALK